MRYDNSKLLRDENGTRYLNRIEYPVIPIQDSDIKLRGVIGQTFENLANKSMVDNCPSKQSKQWFYVYGNQ